MNSMRITWARYCTASLKHTTHFTSCAHCKTETTHIMQAWKTEDWPVEDDKEFVCWTLEESWPRTQYENINFLMHGSLSPLKENGARKRELTPQGRRRHGEYQLSPWIRKSPLLYKEKGSWGTTFGFHFFQDPTASW
jgi:hypothetical protein